MGNYVKVKGAETGKTYNVTAEDFSKFYDDYVANSAGATVEMYDMDGNKKSVGIADAKDMYGQGYTYWQGQHNYHAGKIRAAEARKKAAEEKAKEEEPANAVSQAKQMVKPQKPTPPEETKKQEAPTPAAEAPKAAPKQEKKRQPLTEAEKMEMMYGTTMQNIAGTVAKTDHAIDKVKAQTEIAKKPIQADRKIKLGENRKTIETAAFNPETGKVEKQYYDELGNKFDNRAEADLTGNLADQYNSELHNFDAELSSAEADLERLKSERDEARAARGKTLGILHHAPGSLSTQEETKYNLEDNAYNAAIRQAEERIKNLTEERDARNGEDVGFWRGVGRAVFDGRTWDFGVGDARDMSTMLQLQSEDGLTDSQKKARQAMMESLYKSQQTEQKYSGNRDFWYRAGTTTGMMPAFMVDFAASTLTGGSSAALKVGSKVAAKVATKALGEQMVESMAKKGIKAFAKEAAKDVLTQGASKTAAKTAARDAAKKYTANWAIKALGTTADDLLVRAPLMTNTIQVNKTFADTVGRKLGDVTRDDNGNFSFENSKSWGDAAWQGEANAIIENYSEMFGAHLDPVMTLENASKLAGTFGAKRLSELFSKGSKAGIDSAMGQTKKLFEKAGVSDYVGEVSEEYYGQLWRTMLNLDDAYIENEDGSRTNNFLNAQFHGDILGGMALSMGLMSGAKAGFSAASYHKMKKDLRGYEADARVLLGDDKWDVIKATLQATTNDNIGNFIATIKNDKDLTEEDKTAVLKYTEGSMRLRGFDMGEFKQKEEESQRQQWEQPNEQAATEAGHAIASQADVMGEQPNGDVVRQESQEYRDAQQALAEANKTILPKISSLDTDGLLSDVDITAVSTEGLTQILTALPPQLRDAVTEYISIRNVADNAAIRHQAMLDGLSNSIDEAAEKHYAANMSNTDEGLSDVVEYTDEQGQLWYVRNGLLGDVTLLTNENGEVKWVPTEDIAANGFYGQSKESALDSLRTSLQEKITQEYGLAEGQQNEQQPQNVPQQEEGAPQQSETQEGEQPPTEGQQEEVGFVFPQKVDEEGNIVDDFAGEGVTPENAVERLRTIYGMSDEDIAAWASSWRGELDNPKVMIAPHTYNREKEISEGIVSTIMAGELDKLVGTVVSEQTTRGGKHIRGILKKEVRKDGLVVYSAPGVKDDGTEISKRYFPMPKGLHVSEESSINESFEDGAKILGVKEIRYSEGEIPSAAISVKYPDGFVEHYEVKLAFDNAATTQQETNGRNESTEQPQNATEQATGQPQALQIPTDKNGNKLYFEGSVAPKDAVDDILADLEGDMDATETAVNDELAGAQDALNKVSQEKATGIVGTKAKKAKEKEASAVVDYWQSVADEIATRKQTARSEEEAAIKAAAEKERAAAEANGQIPDWRHDTPEAARQRGFRISEGERYDRQDKIDGIEGRESKAVFTNKDGDTKDGRLMLVDINSVQESHKGSMKNPYHFIPEAQPKDRTSSASRTDTAVNAAPENFKPELLTGDGVVYNESAPIINSRGEVIQGNGRVMTMREVYKNPESAARYKQYLKEHAAEFGLTPEDIDKMEQPILVNRVDVDDTEAIRLGQFKATDLESGGSQRIEPRETIQKMGDWFRSFINKIFNGEEDESIAQLIDKNGIEVLKHMNSRGFISNTQVETAIRNGKLTAEGKNDIMNILKHHLFDGAPSELEAMFNGMPAKAQKAILSTYLRDYEVPAESALLDDIRASIMAYHELQQEEKFNKATTYEGAKTAISDWLRQQNMFDGIANKDKFSNFALELAAREKVLSQKALTELFNTYYDMTSKSASVGGDLFSEADTKTYTKAEAIKKLFNVDIEESKNNGNELQGSNALAGDGRPRGEGRQGGSGNAASGESNAPGAESADGGTRTGRDGAEGTESVVSERENYIKEHPLTAEEIDAADMNRNRKARAKAYLDGTDTSELAKGSYASVYEHIQNNKPNEVDKPTTPTRNKENKPSSPKPKEGNTTGGNKTGSNKPTRTLDKTKQSRFDKLTDKWKKTKSKDSSSNFDAYKIDVLTSEQRDLMLDTIDDCADISYEMFKDGDVESKQEWKDILTSELKDTICDVTGYNDKDFDELLDDIWNSPYNEPTRGETKSVSEWAKDFNIKDEPIKDNDNEGNEEDGGNGGTDMGVDAGNTPPVGSSSEEGGGTQEVSVPGNSGQNMQGDEGSDVHGGNGQSGSGGNAVAGGKHTNAGTGNSEQVRGSGRNNGGRSGSGANNVGGVSGDDEATSVRSGVGRNTVGRNAVDLTKEKVTYVSANDTEGKHAIGSVIPSGAASAINAAFDRLVKETKKNVAEFVRDELGYSSDEEMYEGLSSEQVDSVALAINSMKKGKSFIIGDMTGVGKGRQAAALLRWAKQSGKKVIFVTESSKLFSDMYGDMKDIGSDYLPFAVNDDVEANITDGNGVKLVPKPNKQAKDALWQSEADELPKDKKGRQYDMLFMTYSQVQSDSKSSKEKRDWITNYAKDAIIVMDESHNASGLSKRGDFFRNIVENAGGVTFLSATYAKRPDNMLVYALRSSLSDVNMSKEAMFEAIKKYGVPMQEILAGGLFGSGEMIRRERDMTGVKTTWCKMEDTYSEEEIAKSRNTSDVTMDIINDIIDFQKTYVNPIVREIEASFAEYNAQAAKTGQPLRHCNNTPYSSQVSNIMNLLTYGLKAQKAADMAIEQIKQGMKPVIAVENTLGSYVDEIEGNVDSASFDRIFEKGIKFALRYNIADYLSSKLKETEQIFDAYDQLPPEGLMALDRIRGRIKDYLEDEGIEQLTISPIDLIKKKLADAGYRCGEITGRTKQLVKGEDGTYHTEGLKIKKKDAATRFNGGTVSNPIPEGDRYNALILNVAGATGISLQAKETYGDQRPRSMIILQPARDVNIEVQMRGRIDRTGQVHRGSFYYITSPIPAEHKITMMLKQKLASLDANTVGTEKVSSNTVEAQNMDNKYGDEVAYEYLLEHLNDVNSALGSKGITRDNKTGEWERREGLLYDIMKGIQLLPCEMQEQILEELSVRYADKIEYLNQNGINDLESSTLNLDAVTIDKAVFVKGKDNDSVNEFAHDTHIERVEANVLKKPMRSKDVVARMKKLGSMDAEGKIDPYGYEEKIEADLKATVESMLHERREKLLAAEEKQRAKLKDALPQKEGETAEEYEARLEKQPSLAELKRKNSALIKEYDAELEKQMNDVLYPAQTLEPGMVYLVPLTDELKSDAPMSWGRFLGFEVKNGQPRSIQAVFAVKDSRASISVPCVNSKKVIEKIVNNRNDVMALDIRRNPENGSLYAASNPKAMEAVNSWWDARIPKNTNRTHRYMITGNILQACDSLGKYKGQIVTFTRKDPQTGEITTEKGMLLAENFDPENFKVRGPVTVDDVYNSDREIKDERSNLSARAEGDHLVITLEKKGRMDLTKHPFMNDPELADLAMTASDGTKFSLARNSVAMMFPKKNAEKVLELLNKNYSFTKDKFFVMPDSSDKPDAIIRSNRPFQETIDELSKKYKADTLYAVKYELERSLKRYKMDVGNEDLKTQIRELVQLRQAYLRERHSKESNENLAWEKLILDGKIEGCNREIERAENDSDLRRAKAHREDFHAEREAILEELESRGVKGKILHLKQGDLSIGDAKGLFDKLNTDKENAELMDMVYSKLKDLGLSVVLDNSMQEEIAGAAGGRTIRYNWRYFNAEFVADQQKADTILHEMIHTATVYAVQCVELGDEHLLRPDMVSAVNKLEQIYNAMKEQKEVFTHNGTTQYGLTNVKEMMSEFGSNKSFREDVKKAGLWTKIISGIMEFFGFEKRGATKTSAYETIKEHLEDLIDGFDRNAWEQTYPNYSFRRLDNMAQRKSYAQSVVDSLGGKGKVVTDAKELDHTGKKALRDNKNMTGYYDPKTGEVVVYLPNCHSHVDIERTVQHEKIGHEGLRGLMGEKGYKDFLRQVYLGLSEADRHIINEKMMRDDKLSLYNAIDEYLAEKAEVFNDSNRSLWQRVKDVWNDTMRGLGFKQSNTEGDIRTALWLSKNRLTGNDNSLEYRIRKAAFNSSLKKYHPTEATSRDGYTYDTNDVDEDGDSMSHLLYRTKNMSDADREAALENLTPEGRDCLRQYNDRLANWKYAWTEAHGDRLASVRELLDTILRPKKNEKIDSKYDIASKMEALGSKNQQEQEAFTRKYAKPIFKKLSELSTFFDGETPQERYRNLEAYAYVKHALERNRTLFVRDAIKKMEASDDPAIQAYSAVAQKDYDAERNRLLGELNKGNIDLRQFYSELDNYIANNIASFDAAHNDMSGLSDPDSETMKSLGISVSKKGEYNEDAALDYVMNSESKMGKSNVDEIWGMINEVSRGNVEREYNAGLINQKARDRMQSMFSWYLPLRGFDAKTSEEVYGYIGENGLSGFTANPKTEGRVSQAETPISTLLAMSDYSIFRSNKNEMKRSLVMLARDHQNNLVTEYETWYHETVDASGNKVLEASYPELREDMTAAEIAKAIEDHEATILSKMESGETWVKLKDNKTNSPYRIVKQRQRNQHIVSCMIDGKQVDILIHGNPRAAQAINGLVHDTHWGAWDSINHTLSQLMTSYSLSFMGRNKMRDLEYALASSLTENWKEGKQWNRNFAKMYAQLDFLNPLPTKGGKKEDMTGKYNDSIQGKINNMMKLFSLYRQGKLDMSNDVHRWFHEFVTNGGMTGFTSMIGRDDYEAQIQRTVAEYFDKKGSNKAIRLAQLSGEKATKLFSAYFNTVEKLNEAVENQTRFAAYCASRMERRSVTRSVADAKDVSINFNRTGSGWSTHSLRTGEESTMWKINRDAAALTATYMRHTAWFYNAAIQGMVRNLKLFKDGDAAQRARFFVNMAALPMATYAVATLSSAAIAAALDGDDDKKKFGDNPLDQLPDYVRRQNFCLYTGHGRFIMIPLAIELRAMYGLADVCSRAGRGLPSEKGYGNELFEQFTQLTPYDLGGGSKVGTNGVLGSATGIVTPSNLQGLIACATNVKWTGGPVSGRSDWNASDAEWQRGLSTTSPFYVGMSRYLSTDFSNAMADAADKLGAHETAVNWRGDDKGVKGGVVDINPAWAQYIVETYLGGPGKDFGEAASYLQSKASDVKEYGWSSITNDKGEADLTRTPIIKAFTRSATPNNAMATNRSRWYAYNKEYNDETKPWIKGYAKNRESLDFKMLMASKKGQIGRVVAAYSPIIKQMQARKNAATTHAEREHAQWMMNDYINRAIEMIDKIEKKK